MLNAEIDWPELVQILSKYSQSKKAEEICLTIQPVANPAIAENLMSQVMLAMESVEGQSIPDLTTLDPLGPILERLSIQGTLEVREFVKTRAFLSTAAQLKQILKLTRNQWTEALLSKIGDFRNFIAMIDKAISLDGQVKEDASPTLSALNEEKRKLTREVAFVLDRVIARKHIENSLQDRYVTTREGRLVLPIKSGNQHDLKGLIHDRSFSKQTVFIEPEEAVPINNRLRDLQLLIAEEIEKILREMSLVLFRDLKSLENAETALLEADVMFAKAKLAKNLKANKVHFSKNHQIHLKDMRHPLLVLQGLDVVPNTVSLNNDKRVLLLSGPNAGGKTVLLKSIGLCSQMARSGLPISATEDSVIPFFYKIDSVVGDLQSVDQNLSSFSSLMKRLIQTLSHEGLDNLVLIDEICGATDPEEGSALARSFIEHYINKNIFAVITSHLGPLKENWKEVTALEHGSMEFDVKNNQPTYQLLLGVPGQSLAISVARRLGVPEFILKNAEDKLSPHSRQKSENLREIEELRGQIIEIKSQAQADREEALQEKNAYKELVKRFRQQRDLWLEKALQKAEKKIDNIIEDARQQRLKNQTIQDIKAELPNIIKGQTSVKKAQTIEEFKNLFKPGTPAYSTRLGRNVIIQSEVDQKGQVMVQADSMRIQIPWHTIQQNESEAPKMAFHKSTASAGSSSTETPVLDLRGKRVDEALDLAEKWLDNCMRDGVSSAKVIHGFGTEQLKKSLRQYLSKSHYVSKWTAGDNTSGGDGITWVYLDI